MRIWRPLCWPCGNACRPVTAPRWPTGVICGLRRPMLGTPRTRRSTCSTQRPAPMPCTQPARLTAVCAMRERRCSTCARRRSISRPADGSRWAATQWAACGRSTTVVKVEFSQLAGACHRRPGLRACAWSLWLPGRSNGGRAAVDGDDLARDIRRSGRGEEDGDAFEVFGSAQALEGGAFDDAVANLGEHALAHFRREEAGADAIDRDVVLGQGCRQRTGEVHDGAFAGVVGQGLHHAGLGAAQASYRGDVDDAAAVVDQDVDLFELVEDLLYGGFDVLVFGDVAADSHGFNARLLQLFDGGGQAIFFAGGDGDGGARFAETVGDL